jgi:hypothetical protein
LKRGNLARRVELILVEANFQIRVVRVDQQGRAGL